MLKAIGDFLGTRAGFWFTMALSAASIVSVPVIGVEPSTYILSVIAIILPAFIIKHDHDRDQEQAKRDKRFEALELAVNRKLDKVLEKLS